MTRKSYTPRAQGKEKTRILTMRRKHLILMFRFGWMSNQKSLGEANGSGNRVSGALGLGSKKWTTDLHAYLNSVDTEIRIEDVRRWIDNHSWITDPKGFPKGIDASEYSRKSVEKNRHTLGNQILRSLSVTTGPTRIPEKYLRQPIGVSPRVNESPNSKGRSESSGTPSSMPTLSPVKSSSWNPLSNLFAEGGTASQGNLPSTHTSTARFGVAASPLKYKRQMIMRDSQASSSEAGIDLSTASTSGTTDGSSWEPTSMPLLNNNASSNASRTPFPSPIYYGTGGPGGNLNANLTDYPASSTFPSPNSAFNQSAFGATPVYNSNGMGAGVSPQASPHFSNIRYTNPGSTSSLPTQQRKPLQPSKNPSTSSTFPSPNSAFNQSAYGATPVYISNGISPQASPHFSNTRYPNPGSTSSLPTQQRKQVRPSKSIQELKRIISRVEKHGFIVKNQWQTTESIDPLQPPELSFRVKMILEGMHQVCDQYGGELLGNKRQKMLSGIEKLKAVFNRIMTKIILPVTHNDGLKRNQKLFLQTVKEERENPNDGEDDDNLEGLTNVGTITNNDTTAVDDAHDLIVPDYGHQDDYIQQSQNMGDELGTLQSQFICSNNNNNNGPF